MAYFKYSILFERTFFSEKDLSFTWRIALPLGISFYTFQQIAFLSDIYRSKIKEIDVKTYAIFKLFFPQFVAGPIVHYNRVAASYKRWPTFNARSVKFGLIILSIGLCKKLFGDHFAVMANAAFDNPSDLTMVEAWIGMLSFSFQIYFDFAGYSDMAVGLARMFGVSLPFNFNSPYKSASVSEFWRRWHITLSSWLRDYLYIALGGNRKGRVRTSVNLFLTMAIGGLWHGASWTFLGWGALHGGALVLMRKVRAPTIPRWIKVGGVFTFVTFVWVLFRAQSFDGAVAFYAALFNVNAVGMGEELARALLSVVPFTNYENVGQTRPLGEIASLLLAMVICFSMPNSQQISLWLVARRVDVARLAELPVLVAITVLLSLAFISPDTRNAFIYFEF
ncbi:MBOAT family O-acyltransferase [Neorhizobium sp. NPDC001467]|uniref:MBOAT family O-acyltransferase n=1 Tax=Neorhizobium sp. NPDC001467 TaxID=3390595 RepID=UPI003CFC4DAA